MPTERDSKAKRHLVLQFTVSVSKAARWNDKNVAIHTTMDESSSLKSSSKTKSSGRSSISFDPLVEIWNLLNNSSDRPSWSNSVSDISYQPIIEIMNDNKDKRSSSSSSDLSYDPVQEVLRDLEQGGRGVADVETSNGSDISYQPIHDILNDNSSRVSTGSIDSKEIMNHNSRGGESVDGDEDSSSDKSHDDGMV